MKSIAFMEVVNRASAQIVWRVKYDYTSFESTGATFEDRNYLIYLNDVILDTEKEYFCCHINLPYRFRNEIISNINKSNLYDASQLLFKAYVEISEQINTYLNENKIDVQTFCCIHNYDFCLVSSSIYNFEKAKMLIELYLNNKFPLSEDPSEQITSHKVNLSIIKKENIINSDRQFVKHNPNFYRYYELMHVIQNLKVDSPDRKMELSLFSSLILKDLVESTHLYWLYESGELRRETSEVTHIIFERDYTYFKHLMRFCQQAEDHFIFHDWIWGLVFLTQTLLASLKHRSLENCKNDDEINEHTNFFGFVPIIEDDEENHSEVMSMFTRHISRNFCHGFLIIPSYSIYSLADYLPAYIHEFFHYIPPRNRDKRNKAILTLVLHSILGDLRNNLSKDIYDKILIMFLKEIDKNIKMYGFEENTHTFFECDSMEFSDRIRSMFLRMNFEDVYEAVIWDAFIEFNDINLISIMRKYRDNCTNQYNVSALNYIVTFAMFFREIRSDIAMCSFFNMKLKEYVEVLAKEPLFSVLPKKQCADSTILRFGFMCRYLLKKEPNYQEQNWKKDCKNIINGMIPKDLVSNEKETYIIKLNHLKDYLDEYEEITIESADDCYLKKGQSFIERFLEKEKIVSVWEESICEYMKHIFPQEINRIYEEYQKKTKHEKLICMCGFRYLFRDLLLYDSNLDQKEN